MTAVLDVRGLSKDYGGRKVVDRVSLVVNPAEIVGLLGRNGAGKTTTFRMIVGLVTPKEGRIFLNGEDVTHLPVFRRARMGLAFLSQESSVFQGLTVLENILAILEVTGTGRDRRATAMGLLREYGLDRLERQKAHTLSGGEKRRLEICRALAGRPSVVLLDEPFAGVDPIAVGELQGLIRGLQKKGIAVLLTDHNVRETLRVTDRSLIIDAGVVLAEGPPALLVNNALVRERYLGEDFKLS